MSKLSLNYTGIGSLPLKGENAPVEAVNFVFKNFKDIPFWAQLPHFEKHEDMILQFTQNLCGFKYSGENYFFDSESDEFFENLEKLFFDYEEVLNSSDLFECEAVLDKYAITPPYSNVLPLFLNELKNHKTSYVKGSVTGPFTLSTSLNDKNGKCAFYDETLRDVIVKTLALKALWQVKEFKKVSADATPIIFMDEPSISQIGSCAFLTVKNEDVIEMLREISNVIKKFNAISGVHCCGKTDWNISIKANVDVINFDAFSYTESISTFASEIQKFMENGGYLAFGIVPTLDTMALSELDETKIVEKFEKSIQFLINKKIPKDLILKQSFITPSCGCGSLSVQDMEKAFKLTQNLSEQLRGIN